MSELEYGLLIIGLGAQATAQESGQQQLIMRRCRELLEPIVETYKGKQLQLGKEVPSSMLIYGFGDRERCFYCARDLYETFESTNASQRNLDQRTIFRVIALSEKGALDALRTMGRRLRSVASQCWQLDKNAFFCDESFGKQLEEVGLVTVAVSNPAIETSLVRIDDGGTPIGTDECSVVGAANEPLVGAEESSFDTEEGYDPTSGRVVLKGSQQQAPQISETVTRILNEDESPLELDIDPQREAMIERGNRISKVLDDKQKNRHLVDDRQEKVPLMPLLVFSCTLVAVIVGGYFYIRTGGKKPEPAPKDYERVWNPEESKKRLEEAKKSSQPVQKLTHGTLTIITTPRQARIYLDGKFVGQKTPLKVRKVKMSNHTVRVQRPGYEDAIHLFNMDESEELVHLQLSKE